MTKVVTTEVRGLNLRLLGHTRALELCARMNRETEVLDFIDQIEEGEVFYDLGACEGRFSIYAALRGVRCFSFEPETLNFETLIDNVGLNGEKVRQYLTPLKYAVGKISHKTTIKIAQPWAGGHHRVISDAAGRIDLDLNFALEQEVEVVSLDELAAARHLPMPDYIKVDIDGSELAFIEGAKSILGRPQLKALMFELHSQDIGCRQIIDRLSSYGFQIDSRYEIEPNLFNVWFKRCAESLNRLPDSA